MASYYDARTKAQELTSSSLEDIAAIILDLEEKVEGLEDQVYDLTKQLEEQE